MEKISQTQIIEASKQIRLTEAWVRQHLERGLGRELIEGVLSDIMQEVASGEVRDIFGM